MNQRRHLRFLARLGLSPFIGASLVFVRLNLAEKWPLLVAIGMILSVLLYMELLVKKKRGLTTNPAPHGESLTSQADCPRENRVRRELTKLRGSLDGHRGVNSIR